jgi:hypothetical protein
LAFLPALRLLVLPLTRSLPAAANNKHLKKAAYCHPTRAVTDRSRRLNDDQEALAVKREGFLVSFLFVRKAIACSLVFMKI